MVLSHRQCYRRHCDNGPPVTVTVTLPELEVPQRRACVGAHEFGTDKSAWRHEFAKVVDDIRAPVAPWPQATVLLSAQWRPGVPVDADDPIAI
jgi:hypothetical protein